MNVKPKGKACAASLRIGHRASSSSQADLIDLVDVGNGIPCRSIGQSLAEPLILLPLDPGAFSQSGPDLSGLSVFEFVADPRSWPRVPWSAGWSQDSPARCCKNPGPPGRADRVGHWVGHGVPARYPKGPCLKIGTNALGLQDRTGRLGLQAPLTYPDPRVFPEKSYTPNRCAKGGGLVCTKNRGRHANPYMRKGSWSPGWLVRPSAAPGHWCIVVGPIFKMSLNFYG